MAIHNPRGFHIGISGPQLIYNSLVAGDVFRWGRKMPASTAPAAPSKVSSIRLPGDTYNDRHETGVFPSFEIRSELPPIGVVGSGVERGVSGADVFRKWRDLDNELDVMISVSSDLSAIRADQRPPASI